MIKIDFEFDTSHGVFRDALHLPDDHGLTDEQIDALKAERRDNWIAAITAPADTTETIEIAGEVYQKLDGAPPSGAKLIEVDGVRYARVD